MNRRGGVALGILHMAVSLIALTVMPNAAMATELEEPRRKTRIGGSVGDGQIRIDGSVVVRGGSADTSRPPPPDAAPAGTVTHRRWVYACPGNGWAADPPTNVSCEAAIQSCATSPTQRACLAWTADGPPGNPPPPGPAWSVAPGSRTCLDPATAAAADPAPVPVVTAEDFRRLPLEAGVPHVLTGEGQVLLNVPTIVHAEASPATFPLVLLGQPVTVRAAPVHYTWDFGDGSPPLVTADSGRPYPDHTLSHTYLEPGDVAVVLTTTWAGEYSVAGGPWLAIDGTAEVTSPAEPVTVVEARARLIG